MASVWSLCSSFLSFLGGRGEVNSPQNEESAQQGEGSAQHASTHPTSQQNHAHSGGTMGPPPPAAALEGGGLRSSAIPPQSVRSAAHSTSSVSSGHSHISRDSQVGAGASNLMQMAQGGQNLPTIPLKSTAYRLEDRGPEKSHPGDAGRRRPRGMLQGEGPQ